MGNYYTMFLLQMDVIVGSSRTGGMKHIPIIRANSVEVFTIPGGTYRKMWDVVKNHVTYHEPLPDQREKSVYYIMAGICDLTTKISDQRNHYAEVTFTSTPESSIRNLKSEIIHLRDSILSVNATPVFCTICPQNIQIYNNNLLSKEKTLSLKHEKDYHHMQTNLHKAVELANIFINTINHELNLHTPILHRSILHFKGKGKKTYFRYSKFTDGCHPNQELKQEWARLLIGAMAKNRAVINSS